MEHDAVFAVGQLLHLVDDPGAADLKYRWRALVVLSLSLLIEGGQLLQRVAKTLFHLPTTASLVPVYLDNGNRCGNRAGKW